MPTILLHIYEDAEQDNRLEFALALARSQYAHISCVHAQLVNGRLWSLPPAGKAVWRGDAEDAEQSKASMA